MVHTSSGDFHDSDWLKDHSSSFTIIIFVTYVQKNF